MRYDEWIERVDQDSKSDKKAKAKKIREEIESIKATQSSRDREIRVRARKVYSKFEKSQKEFRNEIISYLGFGYLLEGESYKMEFRPRRLGSAESHRYAITPSYHYPKDFGDDKLSKVIAIIEDAPAGIGYNIYHEVEEFEITFIDNTLNHNLKKEYEINNIPERYRRYLVGRKIGKFEVLIKNLTSSRSLLVSAFLTICLALLMRYNGLESDQPPIITIHVIITLMLSFIKILGKLIEVVSNEI